MRALIVGAVSVLGAIYLSSPALAGKKNAIAVNIFNKTTHSIGLEKEPTWDPKPSDWIFTPPTITSGSDGFFGIQTAESWISDRSFTMEVGGYDSNVPTSDPYGQHESCELTVKMYGVGNGFAGPGCDPNQHPQITAIFKNRTKYDLSCEAVEKDQTYNPQDCTVQVNFRISSTGISRF